MGARDGPEGPPTSLLSLELLTSQLKKPASCCSSAPSLSAPPRSCRILAPLCWRDCDPSSDRNRVAGGSQGSKWSSRCWPLGHPGLCCVWGWEGGGQELVQPAGASGWRGLPEADNGGAAGPLPGDELLCRPARGGLCGRKGQTIISLSHCWRGHGRGQHDSRAGRGGIASHPPPARTGPCAPRRQHPQLDTEGHSPGLVLSTVPPPPGPAPPGTFNTKLFAGTAPGQSCGLSAER